MQPTAGDRVGGQFGGDRGGQPQAQPERVGTERLADRHRVGVQLGDDSGEILGRMHVRAVSEVDGAPTGVAQPHQLPPRRIELPAKVGSVRSSSVRSSRPDCP
ncbi:hypothetical protein GCM10029963_63600 [Micromonospora andamanensis]